MATEETNQDLIKEVKEAVKKRLREIETIKKEKNISDKELDEMVLGNKEARENISQLFKEVKKLILHLMKKKMFGDDEELKELLEKTDEAEKELKKLKKYKGLTCLN